jgi:hypothetical protein
MTIEELMSIAGRTSPLVRGIVLTEEQSAAIRATIGLAHPFNNPMWGIDVAVLPDDVPAPEGWEDMRA